MLKSRAFFRYSSLILACCCLIPVVFLGVILSTDYRHILSNPEQIFYDYPMREQAQSIIDFADFDALILGSSMMENSDAHEASRLFQSTFVNLSIPGASFQERALVLDYLFQQKPQIKQIIYSFDEEAWARHVDPHLLQAKGVNRWVYLYDQQLKPFWRALKFYRNSKDLEDILLLFLGAGQLEQKDIYGSPHEWASEPDYQDSFQDFSKWYRQDLNAISKIKEQGAQLEPQQLRDYSSDAVANYLFSLVKERPQTDFILMTPPYSTLFYSLLWHFEPEYFRQIQLGLKEAVVLCEQYQNCSFYGFMDEPFTDQLTPFYKDILHYPPCINSLMLQSAAQGQHRLDSNNIDAYIELVRRKAQSYDFMADVRAAEAVLKSRK